MTILLTTHDMEEADFLCDQLAILHQGGWRWSVDHPTSRARSDRKPA